MKHISIFILSLVFIQLSCVDDKDSYGKMEIIPLSEIDSLYQLSNGMRIEIKRNTFENQKEILLSVIPVINPLDIIENQLTTLTSNGKHLLSNGMVYISFENQRGEQVKPMREFTISLSESNESAKGTRIFTGKQNKNQDVVWSETSLGSKSLKLDFKDHISTSTEGWLGPKYKNQLLSNVLDSIFSEKGIELNKKLRGQIYFERINNELVFREIIWNKNKNKQLEEELIKTIQLMHPIASSFNLKNNPKTEVVIFESGSLFSEDGITEFSTTDVGWFNFDKYINSPIATVKIKEINQEPYWVYLISNNYERSIRKRYTNKEDFTFILPIEKQKKKFTVYTVTKSLELLTSKEISLEQEKTTEVRM